MNTHHHRVIFNKRRNCMVAVAEVASSTGKGKSRSKRCKHHDSPVASTVNLISSLLYPLKTVVAQTIRAQIATDSIVFNWLASLTADNQINLIAAQNTASSTGTNSASSSSIGVSISSQSGVGITLSASRGRGNADGNDTSFTNTQIAAGNTASITSGALRPLRQGSGRAAQDGSGDLNIKGAVVAANQIKADAGGSLNIESLQDSSAYTSRQQSAGGSITFSPAGVPTGASISASRSNINSNFASVNEQSGLKAGDAGFQVNAGGNTDLKGGVIASTQTAVDNNSNSFTTSGALSITDLQNVASFKASGVSVGVSVGMLSPGSPLTPGGSAGFGSAGGNASSTSSAGISGIAGNTAARTGDANTGLQQIFDADKVQREINAQVAITSAFSKEAPKAVATFSANQMADLKRDLAKEADPDKQAAINAEIVGWDEGGRYRVLLHTLAGAFSGGASGAAGAAASASAAPLMNQLQDGLTQGLKDAGLGDKLAQGIASGIAGLTAAGAGAAVGGTAGAATAFTVDVNNRQLHPAEQSLAKQIAARAKAKGITLSESAIAAALRQAGIKGTNIGPDQMAVMTNPTSTDPNVPGARFDNLMPLLPNTGSALIENVVRATPEAIAFVMQATGGANSPYYWSSAATTPATVVSAPNTGGPQYYTCATTDCLLQGANRNPANTQNQADALRAQNALMAAGLIVGAPLAVAYGAPVLFGMAATAQTVPLIGGVAEVAAFTWGKSAVFGAGIGGVFEFLTNPAASPASLAIAATGGAVGGVAKLGLNATFGLANQWVPTTLANVGTAIVGSQVLGGAAKADLNQLGNSTSGASWLTSPVMTCGPLPRKPC